MPIVTVIGWIATATGMTLGSQARPPRPPRDGCHHRHAAVVSMNIGWMMHGIRIGTPTAIASGVSLLTVCL